MKAKLEKVTEHSIGFIVLSADDGAELAVLRVMSLTGYPLEYKERCAGIMREVADAINTVYGAVDESNLTLPELGADYRHYKGNVYTVTGFKRSSETLETLVCYRNVNDTTIEWARPLRMWFEVIDGQGTQRFTLADKEWSR